VKDKKVFVAMSGGVDSSVAAALLLKRGYNVSGITMKHFKDMEVIDAQNIAKQLSIPHYVIDLTEEFENKIINNFISEYYEGRTPNPCVLCNKLIKFGLLLDKTLEMGADYIATGHYAQIVYDNDLKRYLIKKSANIKKDQSYVLYNLKQEMLKHVLLPVENYTKDEIRAIARDLGLKIASKPESQEICFIKDNDYVKYILEASERKPIKGSFVDKKGNILGQHKGILNYTIGQRKGLGVTFGKPMYVIEIDPINNKIVLGESGEEYYSGLIAENVNYIPFDNVDEELHCEVKVRYTAKTAPAVLKPLDEKTVRVIFEEKQRAVTPGQSAVFYNGDILLGGGIIKKFIS
jgi:tRNA-specific 2-thiouridylase